MPLVHINLSDKTMEMIDKIVEGRSLTEKVKNYLESMPVSRDFLQLELEKTKLKTRIIEKALKENPFYDKALITEPEKKFLIEAIEVIGRKPEVLYGKKEHYNKEFAKRLNLNDFKLLIYEFKEYLEKEEKKK